MKHPYKVMQGGAMPLPQQKIPAASWPSRKLLFYVLLLFISCIGQSAWAQGKKTGIKGLVESEKGQVDRKSVV